MTEKQIQSLIGNKMGVINMFRRSKKQHLQETNIGFSLRGDFRQKNGNFKLKISLSALDSILCKTNQILQLEERIEKLSQHETHKGKEMEDLKETLREMEDESGFSAIC